MPAQHSTFLTSDNDARVVGNMAVLPLRTKFRGPAYPTTEYDIIDEILDLFRVNAFFKNFEIKGPADRTLIYGISYVSDCLAKLKSTTDYKEASRLLNTLAVDHFSIPGEPGFGLNSLYAPPRDRSEADLLRNYLSQLRQELADRLLKKMYTTETPGPNKYWLAFSRRRFMNLKISS